MSEEQALEAGKEHFREIARGLPHERILPFSFLVVDAALQNFLMNLFTEERTPNTRFEWQQLSLGSTRHKMMIPAGHCIGGYKVSAVGPEITVVSGEVDLQALPEEHQDTEVLMGQMALFLNAFADWLYVRQQVITEIAKEENSHIGKIKQFAPDMLEPILDTIKEHNPLDIAFMWYDEKHARGAKATLQDVADRSGYSLSTVEKASAKRSRKAAKVGKKGATK